MKEENEIDNIFKEVIEDFEITPDEAVWETLNDRLDRKNEKKYRPIAFRLFVALIAISSLFVGFIIYHFSAEDKQLSCEKITLQNSRIEYTALNNLNFISKNHKISPTDAIRENQNTSNGMAVKKSNLKKHPLLENLQNNKSENNDSTEQVNNSETFFSLKKPGNNFNRKSEIKNDISKTEDSKEEALVNSTIKDNEISDILNENNFAIQSLKIESITDLLSGFESYDTTLKEPALFNPISSIEKNQLDNKKISKLSALVYFSPDLNYKYFVRKDAAVKNNGNNNGNNSNGNNNDSNDDDKEDYESTEVAKFSFNTGVLIGYDLNRKWTLKSGVSYAYVAQTIQPKTAIAKTDANGETDFQLNTSYGAVVVPSDASAKPTSGDSLLISTVSKQVIQIMNVPLIFKYQIVKNKFVFYTQAGFTANFILKQKLSVDYFGKEKEIKEVRGLKKFYPGIILGLGASYAITKNLQIFLEPNFRGALTPINRYNSKKAYPYTLGLSGGLVFHF